ncbi:Uncharacterised protein [Pseudomonas aeruginosa]|nr:Uncharacterised protein [Pseudomonas aeruginosa]
MPLLSIPRRTHEQRHANRARSAGQRHDLRVLRRPCRTSPEESARGRGRLGQPGQRAGPRTGPGGQPAGPGGGGRAGRLPGSGAQPGTVHRGHDLRQLRRPGRAGAEEGARRTRGQRQPGQRARPPRAARRRGQPGLATGGGTGRLQGPPARRGATTPGRCRAPPAPRTLVGDRRAVAGVAAGAADAGGMGRPALDAAAVGAVPPGDPGAVRHRRALLCLRLARGEGRCRQYGPAGRPRHQRRLRPQRLPLADRPARPHAAPLLRSLHRGDRPDPPRQVPGKPRQAPDRQRHPRP